MPYEVINNKRSKSVIRIVGNTATNVTLAGLSTGVDETVTNVAIAGIHSSTDGVWRIYRGNSTANSVLVLELFGENSLPIAQYDIVVANTSNANLHITNSGTGGTLILSVNKTAAYSPALTGI
jgi:hypothetical protein